MAVHLRGSPNRLRPGSSPHAFRIPSHDGHPAFRRMDFILRPARHYPRSWIWPSSSECQKDFNLPEQRAAQHTLLLHSTPQLAQSDVRTRACHICNRIRRRQNFQRRTWCRKAYTRSPIFLGSIRPARWVNGTSPQRVTLIRRA